MRRTRKTQAVRRLEILEAALIVAERVGYDTMTRDQVGEEAGVSGPTVQFHFGTMAELRRNVMRMAVRSECLPVIAQGLARRDSQAQRASNELQRKAMESLL